MKRSEYLDVLKAIAIIAVVLYHIGYMKYGYLGVDIFLVVNGFLLSKAFKEMSSLMECRNFIIKRILRLYPLTLLATGVCLVWGGYWMLPYQYQDLAQSVIATDLFANNILMSIKSADYWNVLNDYKPLMHTWYMGIIVQFYVFFSLIVISTKKIISSKKDITVYIVSSCMILSLVLYLMPNFTSTQKFYFLPFRIFEFCAGCLTAYWVKSRNKNMFENKSVMSTITIAAYLLILGILFVNVEHISATLKLLLTVLLTCILLISLPHVNLVINNIVSNKRLAIIGRASFSIYIWHQIIFACCRYSFTSVFDAKTFIITILITGLLSYISYNFVEQNISNYLRLKNGERNTLIICICSAVLLIGTSFYINSCSGVVRDVPELDTYVGKTSDRMHIIYNDRVYQWDKDFTTDKQHWLVLGDSYGRDWANIISECELENVEISYVYTTKIPLTDRIERIKSADIIFLTLTEINIVKDISKIDQKVSKMLHVCDSLGIDKNKIKIVGSKRFGQSCGQIYAKKNNSNYFSLNVHLEDSYFEHNDLMREKYNENFIDMLTPVRTGNESVRVFSDDNKIISQDTEHLTQGGAKYYAKIFKPLLLDYMNNLSSK